jgi:UDP-N-acetylmuramyl pentapeptide synthase
VLELAPALHRQICALHIKNNITIMRTEKKFGSVKMMREIRDKLSKEFVNMSYEEQKKYIKERLKDRTKKHNTLLFKE